MARFARDIMARMHLLTKDLEVALGPDTSDLSLRIGLHSGPVTAGVLRGERARFQVSLQRVSKRRCMLEKALQLKSVSKSLLAFWPRMQCVFQARGRRASQ